MRGDVPEEVSAEGEDGFVRLAVAELAVIQLQRIVQHLLLIHL
jgi:hypothetical protein